MVAPGTRAAYHPPSAASALPEGALPFITQADWAVDPVNGDDTNPGTPVEPLETMAELDRRWNGRVFAPSVTAVTLALGSGFPVGADLIIPAVVFPVPATLTVTGSMTTSDSGTVTAYTAPVGGVRALLTDAAQDFTLSVRRRIRFTDGPAAGSVSAIGSLGAGVTEAQLGVPWTIVGNATSGAAAANPVVGNAYVVETFNTVFRGFKVACIGPVQVTTSDVRFTAPALAPTVVPLNEALLAVERSVDRLMTRFFGCQFALEGSLSIFRASGNWSMLGCFGTWDQVGSQLGFQFYAGNFTERGCCWFCAQQVLEGASIEASDCVHDGNGTVSVARLIQNDGYCEDFGTRGRGFFGNINGLGSHHVLCNDGGGYVNTSSGVSVWGAAGNTVTNPMRVQANSRFEYSVVPTATGVVVGNDINVGGVVMAWAALPFINATNNAAAVVRA